MFKTRLPVLALVAIGCFLYSGTSSHGAFLETGDIQSPGVHRAQLGLDAVTSGSEGLNLLGRFATPVHRDAELQVELGGGGHSDFMAGAFLKYVPFPDFGKQPAVGLRAGYSWSDFSGNSASSFHVQPLVSKLWVTDLGDFTPYAALPLAITNFRSESYIPMQLVAGTSFKPRQLEKVTFQLEYGMNLIRSYSHIALSAQVQFSEGRFVLE